MTEAAGPYLQMAAICEKVIEDKTNTLSLIRIIDNLTQTTTGPEPARRESEGTMLSSGTVSMFRLANHFAAFLRLPRPAQLFYLRGATTALRVRDSWTLKIAVRPLEFEQLLDLAKGKLVAEIGTGTGWCALLLAACGCGVFTCDRIEPPQRRLYLTLVSSETAERVQFANRRGEEGPPEKMSVGLLFIDASHMRDETISIFKAWEPAVAPGGAVAFHDFTPAWPGVVEAIAALGLEGETHGALFVWRKPREI